MPNFFSLSHCVRAFYLSLLLAAMVSVAPAQSLLDLELDNTDDINWDFDGIDIFLESGTSSFTWGTTTSDQQFISFDVGFIGEGSDTEVPTPFYEGNINQVIFYVNDLGGNWLFVGIELVGFVDDTLGLLDDGEFFGQVTADDSIDETIYISSNPAFLDSTTPTLNAPLQVSGTVIVPEPSSGALALMAISLAAFLRQRSVH